MSRFITVETQDGKKLEFGVQQYACGLYIAVSENGRNVDQFGANCTEEEFIQSIKDDESLKVLSCL